MLKKRLIFTLLSNNGTFMLSRNFRLQEVGNLQWLAKHYAFDALAHSIDELVVLDVTRGRRDVTRFASQVSALAYGCFVPIAAGGGVRSVADAQLLLRSGADKVIINTAIFDDPQLVERLVQKFGRQAIVGALDYRIRGGQRVVVTHHATYETEIALGDAAERAQDLGVGELYLTSVDRDGTGRGYDLEGIGAVARNARVPVVAAGGVGTPEHLIEGLQEAGASASATANLFNFMADGLIEARSAARAAGVALADWPRGFRSGRVGLVVTARTRSTRLPEKMLADVGGQTAIALLLSRLAGASDVDARVVCTTTDAADDRIEVIARAHGWGVIRGDEEDVLSRYLLAALEHDLELLVNVDGDDLFCSVEAIADVVACYRRTHADLVSVDGLPFGAAPTGVRAEALRSICARKGERGTQGWGKYFTVENGYRVERIDAADEVRRPQYRLTLDYAEDLDVARRLVASLGAELSLAAVVAFLDAHPDVVELARSVSERYWERFHREHGSYTLKPER